MLCYILSSLKFTEIPRQTVLTVHGKHPALLPPNGACHLQVHREGYGDQRGQQHGLLENRHHRRESFYIILKCISLDCAVRLCFQHQDRLHFNASQRDDVGENNEGHVQVPAKERKVHRAGGQSKQQKHYRGIYCRAPEEKCAFNSTMPALPVATD